ncbi:MAG: hypothetical protein MUO26_15065 [Methanotrichaceae archaeon]|nr:hypothetical protein [Methanotrichaceae archaeon]
MVLSISLELEENDGLPKSNLWHTRITGALIWLICKLLSLSHLHNRLAKPVNYDHNLSIQSMTVTYVKIRV